MKKTGPIRRLLTRLESICLRSGVSGYRDRRNNKGPVAKQHRTWKLKKLTHGGVCLMLAAAVGGVGCWLGYIMLLRTDVFAVTMLTVQGNRMASEQQILDRGGLRPGISLLSLDCREAESRMLEHPWVDEATVVRQWPATVLVQVRERNPLAMVNLEREGRRQLYYLDKKGEIFAPTTPSRDLDYPVVTGKVDMTNSGTLRIAYGSLAELALEFLKLAAEGNQVLPSQGVSEVHVSPEKGLIVFLVDYPFPIYMGKEKVKTRFNLLVRVLAQLYRQDKMKSIAEIRMDYAEDKILVAKSGT